MIGTKWILAALACCSASQLAAQDAKLPYPPVDAPLYLHCKMQGATESLPSTEWLGFALYFPSGIASGFPELRIVDPHAQLEGGRFGFSIKAEGHWSLIDSVGVPSSEVVSDLPQIMFLPPSGNGENLRVLFSKNAEIVRRGACFGMIGPNTGAEYDASLADPNRLD